MNSRRSFLKYIMVSGAFLSLSNYSRAAKPAGDFKKITILHTNDTHSQIEPFQPNDPKYPKMGGFARRAAIIRKIKEQEKNVLLFDAGDTFQGTAYFNMFGGELEFKLMSEIGYDAATIGNHEFDNGLEGFAKQLPHAKFPFISSNYDFKDTILANKISKYKIFEKDDLQIGVFGLGVELRGLVDKRNYGNTLYNSPVEIAAQYAHFLKKEKKCDLVICLSHLGYKYQDEKISDWKLAKMSKNIDLIIGGHSHTFLDEPVRTFNSDGKQILISQVGWGGVKLGRLDFYLKPKTNRWLVDSNTINILKNQA